MTNGTERQERIPRRRGLRFEQLSLVGVASALLPADERQPSAMVLTPD
jgi:hypothetical protein